MKPRKQTHYETLGVPPSASHFEIHVAYKKLALQFHPDRCGGETEHFTAITAAWGVLKNMDMRKAYDAEIRLLLRSQQCPKCEGKGTILKQKVSRKP